MTAKAKPKRNPWAYRLGEEFLLICPECWGAPGPEGAIEIAGTGKAVLEGAAKVIGKDGTDRTEQFLAGAQAALAQLKTPG